MKDIILKDTIFSVYDDKKGIVIDIYESKGIQNEYLILWEDGEKNRVYREEIY